MHIWTDRRKGEYWYRKSSAIALCEEGLELISHTKTFAGIRTPERSLMSGSMFWKARIGRGGVTKMSIPPSCSTALSITALQFSFLLKISGEEEAFSSIFLDMLFRLLCVFLLGLEVDDKTRCSFHCVENSNRSANAGVSTL